MIHDNEGCLMTPPILWREIDLPDSLCITECLGERSISYGGDLRMGDLRDSGEADFLVYRSVDKGHDEGGMKSCFLGAFTGEGVLLRSGGKGGAQPSRPGPVAIHDLDGDGHTEVICFFLDRDILAEASSMANVVIQLRRGATGMVNDEAPPSPFRSFRGEGPDWVHRRILEANFRGKESPQDFVVKLGERILAFDSNLQILWE